MALTPKEQSQLNKALEQELSLVEQIGHANKSGNASGRSIIDYYGNELLYLIQSMDYKIKEY